MKTALKNLRNIKALATYCAAVLLLVVRVSAEEVVDTVASFNVPVTYYDYHSDQSNPMFNVLKIRNWITHCDGFAAGLVMDTLDQDRKPIPNPEKIQECHFMENFENWYRRWEPGDTMLWVWPGDTQFVVQIDSSIYTEEQTFWGERIRVYETTIDTVFIPPDSIISDTIYKNAVVHDSLEFAISRVFYPYFSHIDTVALKPVYDTLIIDSIYSHIQQWRDSCYRFSPIDGRGLESAEDSLDMIYNNCFAMEMHNSFVYRGGEFLWVAADDEAWVFIGDHLALDLGGMHSETPRFLHLDSLGLTIGETYHFDLFFSDRLFCSVLEIATDIDFIDKSVGQREMRTIPIATPALSAPVPVATVLFKCGAHSAALTIPVNCTLDGVELYNSTGRRILSGDAQKGWTGSGVLFVHPRLRDPKGNTHYGNTEILVPLR